MFDIVAYEGLKERFFRQVKNEHSQLKAVAASPGRGERRLQNGRAKVSPESGCKTGAACWRSGLPVWDGEADTSGEPVSVGRRKRRRQRENMAEGLPGPASGAGGADWFRDRGLGLTLGPTLGPGFSDWSGDGVSGLTFGVWGPADSLSRVPLAEFLRAELPCANFRDLLLRLIFGGRRGRGFPDRLRGPVSAGRRGRASGRRFGIHFGRRLRERVSVEKKGCAVRNWKGANQHA